MTALALLCVVGMQAVYWLVTHPTNKYWLTSAETRLGKTGERFFAAGSAANEVDWMKIARPVGVLAHCPRRAVLSEILLT